MSCNRCNNRGCNSGFDNYNNFNNCNNCNGFGDGMRCIACVSQWMQDNHRDCIDTIPSGRSEAVSMGYTPCSCSGIVYRSCCSC